MINVQLVPIQMVDEAWSSVAKILANGLRKTPSDISMGDMWTGCRSGAMFLIVAFDEADIKAATIWRFTPSNYFECINIAGVHANVWLREVCLFASRIANDNACKGIVATGRIGWLRPLRQIFPTMTVIRQTYVMRYE